MSNPQLALHFFFQLAVILLVCRAVGALGARFGQPRAVSEMVAGIVLGPSLFGMLMPETQAWLFPWDRGEGTRDTQSYLYPVSQLGLALYTFTVGMGFRTDMLRRHLRASLAVSVAGLVVPFVVGVVSAWLIYHHTHLFPQGISLQAGMLFLGAALSITAFPTLARIIDEKGLVGTTVATISISAGALNDAGAWCILAVIIASAEHDIGHAIQNIGSGVAYVAVVLLAVRPLLARMQHWWAKPGASPVLSDTGFAMALALMAIGAWCTDRIGLHAVFGAFIMGAAMPRGFVTHDMVARLYSITSVVLLPLFFTFSGLNTKIGLLDTPLLWLVCAGLLLAAVLGKGVACWLAARAAGIGNHEALGIGALMNARGLMELIIINIGLQRGIISEGLFAALALMAVVTTLMTVPLFDRVMRTSAAGHR